MSDVTQKRNLQGEMLGWGRTEESYTDKVENDEAHNRDDRFDREAAYKALILAFFHLLDDEQPDE